MSFSGALPPFTLPAHPVAQTMPAAPRPPVLELNDEFSLGEDHPDPIVVVPNFTYDTAWALTTPPLSPLLLPLFDTDVSLEIQYDPAAQFGLWAPTPIMPAPIHFIPALSPALAAVDALAYITPSNSPVQSTHSLDPADEDYPSPTSSSDASSIKTPSPPASPTHHVIIATPGESSRITRKRLRDDEDASERPRKRRPELVRSAPSSPRPIARAPPRLGATRSLNYIEDLRSSRSVGPTQGSTSQPS